MYEWPDDHFGERTASSEIGLAGYDAWLTDVGEWPDASEDDDLPRGYFYGPRYGE